MPFDTIVPVRTRTAAAAEAVQVRMINAGKAKTLTLEVMIGGNIVERLGWRKGQRVHLGVGANGSPERGQLAIWPADDGHFTTASPGGGRSLSVSMRTLHPTLVLREAPKTVAVPVHVAKERLVIKLPAAMLTPPQVGQIMGDEHRQRA